MTFFHPNDRDLYVVDGQHRIAALAKLVEQDPDKWRTYQVPFVCMIGATEMEEMRQFYVVNSAAKSVRTDLALDLLKQQAENDPDLMASLVERARAGRSRPRRLPSCSPTPACGSTGSASPAIQQARPRSVRPAWWAPSSRSWPRRTLAPSPRRTG